MNNQKDEPLMFKRFPNGKIYLTNEAMSYRLCSGLAGTCGTSLSDTWHDPICPCCRAEINLRKIAVQMGWEKDPLQAIS